MATNNSTKNTEILLYIFLFIVVVVWVGLWWLTSQKIDDYRQVLAEKSLIEEKQKNLESLKRLYTETESDREILKRIFIDRDSATSLIEKLEMVADSLKIKLDDVRADDSNGLELGFSADGSFVSLYRFLILITEAPELLMIEKIGLELKTPDKAKQGTIWRLNLKLKVLSFKNN